jgi:hypothetical protein
MSDIMSSVKEEAIACLKEIDAGAQQLICVSVQLENITHKGEEQMENYAKFSAHMKSHSAYADELMSCIDDLKNITKNNNGILSDLQETLQSIGNIARQLELNLEKFQSVKESK